MNPTPSQAAIDFFEHLTPDRVANLSELYTVDAYFKDPFNEVHRLIDMQTIFTHMFQSLVEPRFVVTERIEQGAQCFLVWEFRFRFRAFQKAQVQVIHGGSHLRFAADGRVCYHRDYWDAAEELYEKLPIVGSLMHWLKRRANS